MQGVTGEDKIILDKQEARALRLRSRALLISLIHPVRNRLLLSLFVVVISQMLRVAGPALIALGIDWALPAAMIAAAAWHRLASDGPTSLSCGAYPNLKLDAVPR
jgi:hypothetical protein